MCGDEEYPRNELELRQGARRQFAYSLRTGIREAQLNEVISAFTVQSPLMPERRSGL